MQKDAVVLQQLVKRAQLIDQYELPLATSRDVIVAVMACRALRRSS